MRYTLQFSTWRATGIKPLQLLKKLSSSANPGYCTLVQHQHPISSGRCAHRFELRKVESRGFGGQSVRLTSNACAPMEEATPSVSPARYITTPCSVSKRCPILWQKGLRSASLSPAYTLQRTEALSGIAPKANLQGDRGLGDSGRPRSTVHEPP
jgi:hypothetical protein